MLSITHLVKPLASVQRHSRHGPIALLRGYKHVKTNNKHMCNNTGLQRAHRQASSATESVTPRGGQQSGAPHRRFWWIDTSITPRKQASTQTGQDSPADSARLNLGASVIVWKGYEGVGTGTQKNNKQRTRDKASVFQDGSANGVTFISLKSEHVCSVNTSREEEGAMITSDDQSQCAWLPRYVVTLSSSPKDCLSSAVDKPPVTLDAFPASTEDL